MPPAEPDANAKAVLDFLARRAVFSRWWLSSYGEGIGDGVYMLKLQRGEDYTCRRRCDENLANWAPIILFYADRPDDVLYQLFKHKADVVAKFPAEQLLFLKGDETFDDILAQAEIEMDLRVDKLAE